MGITWVTMYYIGVISRPSNNDPPNPPRALPGFRTLYGFYRVRVYGIPFVRLRFRV